MALNPVSRVGVYEVVAQIGEGGMGQVYRARDTRLNRDVALKVLPERFAQDPERLARFEREARVLASLNHPNIAHIHGLEESGDVRALVMELVDGEDLAQRLARAPIGLEEALAIAKQIADALDAAHELGIVHRDLKPANIKVRADGMVKVLDFGLAKALLADGTGGSDGDFGNSPTVVAPAMSRAGVILGTAAYMSPEQARGGLVDRRTDIWAFGCVLYEMLTGAAAFSGGSITDILAAVIQREPDWSRLPANVPPRIVSLLRRCLQRSAKERLRDIADAGFEIEETLKPATNGAVARAPAVVTPPRAPWFARGWWLLAGAGFATAIVLATGALRAPQTVAGTTVRAIVSLPPDTTIALDRGSAVALSPDGRRLVYAARSKGKVQLYFRSLDRFESLPIAGTDGAINPFFSPDGQWIGFFSEDKLKKAPIEGGAPVAIADARAPRGEAWGPNNLILVTPTNASGIQRVSALGGSPEPASTLVSGELSHRWPSILPDGKTMVFAIWNDVGWEPAQIAAQRIDGPEHKVIVPAGGGYARFVSDGGRTSGYLVYARSEGLMAAKFDMARMEVSGQAVPILDGLITNLSGGAHFDLSASGTLAYVPGSFVEEDRDLAWVTPDGKPTPVLRIHSMGRFFSLSPDGTRIVRTNTTGSKDVWIDDLVRGTNTRVTTGGINFPGTWSRDGKWVAFSQGVPIANLYRRTADGSDVEERLTTSTANQQADSFSPDGAFLAYTEFSAQSAADIWILALPAKTGSNQSGAAGASARPFVKTRFSEGNAQFSPDGRWLAYDSNESGRFEIYVRAFPEGVRKWAVSSDGGIVPVWSASGREIFYRSTAGKLMSVSVDAAADFHVDPPRALFDATAYENTFSVSPDGNRFLMMPRIAPEAAPTQVHLVINWLDELRQRVK